MFSVEYIYRLSRVVKGFTRLLDIRPRVCYGHPPQLEGMMHARPSYHSNTMIYREGHLPGLDLACPDKRLRIKTRVLYSTRFPYVCSTRSAREPQKDQPFDMGVSSVFKSTHRTNIRRQSKTKILYSEQHRPKIHAGSNCSYIHEEPRTASASLISLPFMSSLIIHIPASSPSTLKSF